MNRKRHDEKPKRHEVASLDEYLGLEFTRKGEILLS